MINDISLQSFSFAHGSMVLREEEGEVCLYALLSKVSLHFIHLKAINKTHLSLDQKKICLGINPKNYLRTVFQILQVVLTCEYLLLSLTLLCYNSKLVSSRVLGGCHSSLLATIKVYLTFIAQSISDNLLQYVSIINRRKAIEQYMLFVSENDWK